MHSYQLQLERIQDQKECNCCVLLHLGIPVVEVEWASYTDVCLLYGVGVVLFLECSTFGNNVIAIECAFDNVWAGMYLPVPYSRNFEHDEKRF